MVEGLAPRKVDARGEGGVSRFGGRVNYVAAPASTVKQSTKGQMPCMTKLQSVTVAQMDCCTHPYYYTKHHNQTHAGSR